MHEPAPGKELATVAWLGTSRPPSSRGRLCTRLRGPHRQTFLRTTALRTGHMLRVAASIPISAAQSASQANATSWRESTYYARPVQPDPWHDALRYDTQAGPQRPRLRHSARTRVSTQPDAPSRAAAHGESHAAPQPAPPPVAETGPAAADRAARTPPGAPGVGRGARRRQRQPAAHGALVGRD